MVRFPTYISRRQPTQVFYRVSLWDDPPLLFWIGKLFFLIRSLKIRDSSDLSIFSKRHDQQHRYLCTRLENLNKIILFSLSLWFHLGLPANTPYFVKVMDKEFALVDRVLSTYSKISQLDVTRVLFAHWVTFLILCPNKGDMRAIHYRNI